MSIEPEDGVVAVWEEEDGVAVTDEEDAVIADEEEDLALDEEDEAVATDEEDAAVATDEEDSAVSADEEDVAVVADEKLELLLLVELLPLGSFVDESGVCSSLELDDEDSAPFSLPFEEQEEKDTIAMEIAAARKDLVLFIRRLLFSLL